MLTAGGLLRTLAAVGCLQTVSCWLLAADDWRAANPWSRIGSSSTHTTTHTHTHTHAHTTLFISAVAVAAKGLLFFSEMLHADGWRLAADAGCGWLPANGELLAAGS